MKIPYLAGVDILQIGSFFSRTRDIFFPELSRRFLPLPHLLNVKLIRFGPLRFENPIFSLFFFKKFKKTQNMVHEGHFLPEIDKMGHFFPEQNVRAHLKFIYPW